MNVSSSLPCRSSVSRIVPIPSSTDAIIRARCRISSCSPAWSAARIDRARSDCLRPKHSAQAGFCRITSAGGSMFGDFGNIASR